MIGHAVRVLVVWGSAAQRWQAVSGVQGRGARRMLKILRWEVVVRGGAAGGKAPGSVAKGPAQAPGLVAQGPAQAPGAVAQVPTEVPVLIVANHIGALDPWILSAVFDCSFVGKSEIARWPVVGLVGRAAGLILAHRQNKMKTTRMVDEVRTRMEQGVPVAIFPEGTTSDGRSLLPFKTGGFAALVENGDSGATASSGVVLPVHFHITHINGRLASDAEKTSLTWHGGEELWPWLWRVTPHSLQWQVAIGEPIPARGHTRKSLGQAAHEAVETLRAVKSP